jgi:ribosomal protein L31
MPITRQPYFLPTQITGCSLWLDAADTSSDSMILSGSNISTWKDKSGTGNNATANTGTVTTNSTTINGLNTIRFNTSSFLNIASFTMTANISVFAVLRGVTAQGSGNAGYFFLGNGAQPSFFVYTLQPQFGNISGPYSAWVASTGETNWYMPSSDFFLNNPGFIYTDNSTSYVNGSQLTFNTNRASVPNAVSAGAYSIQVGGRVQPDSLAFDFAECIFYNRTITATQRQQVESYLAQKWGLNASLPAGHPGLQKIIHRNLQTTFTKKQYFTAFSPRQIVGCALWLDGADPAGTGVLPANGTSITSWVDKSGNGYNFTNGSRAAPTYATRALTFTGSGNGANTQVLSNASIPLSTTYSIFAVAVQNASHPTYTGYNYILTANTTVNQYLNIGTGGGTSGFFATFTGYTSPTTAFNDISVNSPNTTMLVQTLVAVTNDNTTLSPYLNGTPMTTKVGTTNAVTGITIGDAPTLTYSGQNWNGNISEIIIFNTAVSTTQRQQVESYLAQKWGLILSLPAGHLNATFPAGSPTAIQPFVASVKTALTGNFKLTFTGSVSSGLLSYFSFNSHLLDFKNTIILSATGSIPYVTGQYGKAIYLANEANSANGSTATNYLTSAYNVTVPFSVSVWFNPTNTNRGSLFSSYNSTGITTYGVNLYIQGGGMSAAYNAIQNVGASYSISTGTWYYAVITVNSSNGLTLFVNGSQVGSTITQTPSINGLMIGNVQDNGGSYAFSGYLDDYRIYNRVLSGGEISAIYAGTG